MRTWRGEERSWWAPGRGGEWWRKTSIPHVPKWFCVSVAEVALSSCFLAGWWPQKREGHGSAFRMRPRALSGHRCGECCRFTPNQPSTFTITQNPLRDFLCLQWARWWPRPGCNPQALIVCHQGHSSKCLHGLLVSWCAWSQEAVNHSARGGTGRATDLFEVCHPHCDYSAVSVNTPFSCNFLLPQTRDNVNRDKDEKHSALPKYVEASFL